MIDFLTSVLAFLVLAGVALCVYAFLNHLATEALHSEGFEPLGQYRER
jgi:hypothetical protein